MRASRGTPNNLLAAAFALHEVRNGHPVKGIRHQQGEVIHFRAQLLPPTVQPRYLGLSEQPPTMECRLNPPQEILTAFPGVIEGNGYPVLDSHAATDVGIREDRVIPIRIPHESADPLEQVLREFSVTFEHLKRFLEHSGGVKLEVGHHLASQSNVGLDFVERRQGRC